MGSSRIIFDKALQAGIVNDLRAQHDTPALLECQNKRACQYGLKDFHAISDYVSDAELASKGITKSWPFPQLFFGKNVTLLATETAIYTVNSSGVLTLVSLKTAADMGTEPPGAGSISAGGGVWQFVDFYNSWMLHNGVATVFKFQHFNYTWVTEAVKIACGTDWYEARVFWGGFNPANMYALADWPTYLDGFHDEIPTEVDAYTLASGMDKNWVWWSSIGGGDLLWLFSLKFMKHASFAVSPTTGYDDDNPYWLDLWKRNEAGARPMPWRGEIGAIKEMGKSVIVYGKGDEGGIAALPVQGRDVGLDDISGIGPNVGIAGRGAVAGDNHNHLFMDTTGELWMVNENRTVESLNYRHIFGSLTESDNPMITFDKHQREFYIGFSDGAGGQDAYLLSQTGLSRAPWVPLSLFFSKGGLQGIKADAGEPNSVKVVSVEFTMDSRMSNGTLESVELIGLNDQTSPWTVAIDYRLRLDEDWSTTNAVPLPPSGKVMLDVPGAQWRVRLEAPDKSLVSANQVIVTLSNDGKRKIKHWVNSSNRTQATGQ